MLSCLKQCSWLSVLYTPVINFTWSIFTFPPTHSHASKQSHLFVYLSVVCVFVSILTNNTQNLHFCPLSVKPEGIKGKVFLQWTLCVLLQLYDICMTIWITYLLSTCAIQKFLLQLMSCMWLFQTLILIRVSISILQCSVYRKIIVCVFKHSFLMKWVFPQMYSSSILFPVLCVPCAVREFTPLTVLNRGLTPGALGL